MVCFIRLTGRDKLLSEGLFKLKENPGTGLCVVAHCRKKHVPEKWGGKFHLCHRHRQERWRRNNPKQASYRALKDHAVARRIPFTLTLDFFIRITTAAGYWDQDAASHGDRLSVDRIDATLGYSNDNIQIITVSENSLKSHRESYLTAEVREILARRRGEPAEAWHMDEGKHWLDDDGDPF